MKAEVEAAGARFVIANLWTMPTMRDDWSQFFSDEHLRWPRAYTGHTI